MNDKDSTLRCTSACFTGPSFLRNYYSFEYLYPEYENICTSYYHSSSPLFYSPMDTDKDVIDYTNSFQRKVDRVNTIYTNNNLGISFLQIVDFLPDSELGGSFTIRPGYKIYDSVMLIVGTLRGSKKYGYDTSVCGDVGVIIGGVNEVWDDKQQLSAYRFLVITGSIDRVDGVCKFLESTGATQVARFMVGPLVILPSGTDDDVIRQEKDKMESIMRWVSDGPCSWLGANLFWHDHDCECFNCSEGPESSANIV